MTDTTKDELKRARLAGQQLRELTAMLHAKRQAYALVARMITQCRDAREVDPSNATIPPGEQAVLRELEAIETAMRNASKAGT